MSTPIIKVVTPKPMKSTDSGMTQPFGLVVEDVVPVVVLVLVVPVVVVVLVVVVVVVVVGVPSFQ